jgi:hypothetical protein
MKKIVVIVIAFFCYEVGPAFGQAVTPNGAIFSHVLMVQSRYGRGSIFSIDVDNREYWITAKHVLNGAEHPPYGSITDKSVLVKILDPNAEKENWKDETFIVVDTGKDVDIVVLVPPIPLLSDPNPTQASSTGATLGGECSFLGFPYGGGWRATFENGGSYWMPFVKHCNISALNKEGKTIWILDGINNEGFSGGPVIIGLGASQKIMAVVSGYHTEPAEVIASMQKAEQQAPPAQSEPKKKQKETVNLNSGFIFAFDIEYAIDAIHKNPIGPTRPAKQ